METSQPFITAHKVSRRFGVWRLTESVSLENPNESSREHESGHHIVNLLGATRCWEVISCATRNQSGLSMVHDSRFCTPECVSDFEQPDLREGSNIP